MAEFKDIIRRRRMVRSFTDEAVAPHTVQRIVDTARRGPSAGFSQGIDFVVITDPATRAAIAAPAQETLDTAGLPNYIAQAPIHVVICVSPEVYRSRYREADKAKIRSEVDDDELWAVPYWYQDAGSALMLLLLAAVDEGIGASFVSSDADFLRELLGIPGDHIPVGVALLGHEAPDARDFGMSATTRSRRSFDSLVHSEHW